MLGAPLLKFDVGDCLVQGLGHPTKVAQLVEHATTNLGLR